MPGPPAGSYRALLADPVVARTVVLALVGRLGYAVLPLSLLFTVRASGGFVLAGAVLAVFGASALAMPLQARAIDRLGQRRVLPAVTTAFVASLVLAATTAPTRGEWIALAVALGLTAPSLGPSMRAQWRTLTPDGPLRTRAYSLDAVCEEVLYLLGPVIAAAMLAHGPAHRAVLLVACLIPIGCLGLVTSPAAAVCRVPTPLPSSPPRSSRPRSPLREPGVRWLLLVMAAFGVTSGLLYTGVAARADAAGRPALAGYVEAVVASASVLGAVVWGRRRHRRPWPTHLSGCLVLQGISLSGAALVSSWWLLAVTLAVAGLSLAPTYTVAYQASDEEARPEARTESSTWVTTVTNLGSAAGTAMAGAVVGAHGGGAPHALGGAVALTAAAVAASVAHKRRRCA